MIPDYVVPGDEAIYLQNKVWYTEINKVCVQINPIRVVEFGVRAGYSARAVYDVCERAEIIGYEGDIDKETKGWWKHAKKIVPTLKVNIVNTCLLLSVPHCNLALVDADHTYGGCLHELELSEKSTDSILLDDINDARVSAAMYQFLALHPSFEIRYTVENRIARLQRYGDFRHV